MTGLVTSLESKSFLREMAAASLLDLLESLPPGEVTRLVTENARLAALLAVPAEAAAPEVQIPSKKLDIIPPCTVKLPTGVGPTMHCIPMSISPACSGKWIRTSCTNFLYGRGTGNNKTESRN